LVTAKARLSWPPIVARAAEIADEYDAPITLRQVFYRLVVEQLIPNREVAYRTLSARSAEARRAGWFPDLADLSRRIEEATSFDSPRAALQVIADVYRRDRTEGQRVTLLLGVEKRGMVAQLRGWFGTPLGIPVVAVGGYPSQTLMDQVTRHVDASDRPGVLLYAGDFDASGEDILRDFVQRTGCWQRLRRVALTEDQVAEFGLPENPGKETDSRARAFAERHGRNVQVEVDALDPNQLRDLFQEAIDEFWDMSEYERVQGLEAEERAELEGLARERGE
jgi:hypothetical protein